MSKQLNVSKVLSWFELFIPNVDDYNFYSILLRIKLRVEQIIWLNF